MCIRDRINSDPVKLEEVPEIVKWAFIAAEDARFYSHPGFDVIGVARSIRNILMRSPDPGGASTITQQVVRILTRDKERSLERKLREIITAVNFEQKFSKDQILALYLSHVPQGSNIVGVKTGASFYFGKELKDLNLIEAAVLAAIVQSPAILSPTRSIQPDKVEVLLNNRVNYILDQLEENLIQFNEIYKTNKGDLTLPDVITKEMIEEARNSTWKTNLKPPIATDKKAGHFVNFVVSELQKKNYYKNERPFTLEELQNGGYKIITTLDYQLQLIAEKYAQEIGSWKKDLNVFNAAISTIRPSNGEIITMAGSRSFVGEKEGCSDRGCKFDPQVNVITSLQQPGSTAKPFGYYEAFREGKLHTGSFLPDVPVTLGNYSPKNWNAQYSGVGQSATAMLRQSKNLPAIFVLAMIGLDNYSKVLNDFGYTTINREKMGWSSIIGSNDVTPLEHAQAYGVFANGGDLVKVDPILKIISPDGQIIYDRKIEIKRVADPQAVYLVNKVLENYDGTSFDGREMSGKTGTTDSGDGYNQDLWLVLYSPDFVTVAWAGNNNNEGLNPFQAWPGTVIQKPLLSYMRDIGNSSYFGAKTRFTMPAFVYRGGGNCNEKGECFGVEQGWLIRGREPEFDHIKKEIEVCTDQPNKLARPIDKAMGYSKTETSIKWFSPVKDQLFQKFIDDYILEKFNVNNGGPKENEFCTIDRTNSSTVPYFYNISASEISTNKLNIKGGVFSNNGSIVSLKVFFDSVLMPSCLIPNSSYGNFDVTCDVPSSTDGGEYTLSLEAIDENNISATHNITVKINNGISKFLTFGSLPSTLSWGVQIGNSISYPININTTGSYSNVVLYQSVNNSDPTVVGNMIPVVGGFSYSWGATIPNLSDSYKFLVKANVGNTGITKTAYSSSISIQPLISTPTPTPTPTPTLTPTPTP